MRMQIRKLVTASVPILVVAIISLIGYKIFLSTSSSLPFKTQKPERRDIHKIVRAEGSLEAQGTSKLGPLINATVKKIYVKDGQSVMQGTLLADLENDSGGDPAVRQAKAQLEQAKAMFTYTAAMYARRKTLYRTGELAQETFEKDLREYQHARAEVRRLQALFDKEAFLLEQTHIRAPHNGTILAINVKEGEAVSIGVSPAIVLFEIAQDLATMKATLYIDESDVGHVHVGMPTEIAVDTYPNRPPWVGKIASIGMSKAANPASHTQQGQVTPVTYKAEVLIDNSEGLLRQDMSVHAKTTIAEVKQALAVPGYVFQLNGKVLETAAKTMNYAFNPIDTTKKNELQKTKGKTLWVLKDKTLTERAVEIGITDNAYFQILSGIQDTDEIIADDMTASEEMKRLAKKFAGS